MIRLLICWCKHDQIVRAISCWYFAWFKPTT